MRWPGEKLAKESDSDTVSQSAYAAAKAKCEPGAKAISGGFASDDYVFDIPRSVGTGSSDLGGRSTQLQRRERKP